MYPRLWSAGALAGSLFQPEAAVQGEAPCAGEAPALRTKPFCAGAPAPSPAALFEREQAVEAEAPYAGEGAGAPDSWWTPALSA